MTNATYLQSSSANNETVVMANGSSHIQSDYHSHYYYGDYNIDDYYALYTDHVFEIFDFEKPLYGYLWPILVIVTSLFNLIVIGGFLRKRMRNPTNLILVFIALSDSLTGLVTLPASFHIYAHGNTILTEEWCNTAMITRLYISRAFHTVSVWETLLLGLHRFLQVRHPSLAQKLCTTKKTIASVLCMYILSFVLHSYHAVDIKTNDGFCVWQLEEPCGWTCVYIWCTLLLGHLLPSAGLVFLAINMMRALNQLNTSIDLENALNRRKERNRKLTLVVVLIVLIFLIPELPYGIFYLMVVSLRHSKQNIFPLKTNRIVHSVYEIILVLSFHLNFWVYCLMIQSFKNLVKNLWRMATCRPVSFDRLESDSSSNVDYELAGMTDLKEPEEN